MTSDLFPHETLGITAKDNIVFLDREPVGILRAGSCFHYCSGQFVVLGPVGLSRSSIGRDEILQAMLASGALLLGEEPHLARAQQLLQQPPTSRNAAFFSVYADSCEELVEIYQKIGSAHLTMVGCGGIGSAVTLFAAGMGVRRFLLIDGDKVELSNLNRQLAYNRSDIGKHKTKALRRALNSRFSDLEIDTREQPVDADVLLSYIDRNTISVLTADTPLGIVPQLRHALTENAIPWISAGYFFSSGIVVDRASGITELENTWSHFQSSIMPSSPINNIAVSSRVLNLLVAKIIGKPIELDFIPSQS
jgi:hypothetical protein